ncbi:MAG: 16S rRNA (guanine(527)-N(7))-methyltransferase RsmG [Ruminococcaceae bacterium]|nr:16S rRNA (guanine(527)-N(7))-methyltransferase RsmG [Oscillospiraceae bacterium]
MTNFINTTTFPQLDEFTEMYLACAKDASIDSEPFTSPDTIRRLWIISCKLTENAKKFNLTSILEPSEIIRKHLVDSLIPLKFILERGIRANSIIDVGCGAGFPCLPIAAALASVDSNRRVVGLDATTKKISHINEVSAACSLSSTQGISARAEEIAKGEYREVFDIVSARAVAALPTLVELCAPFVKVNGHFVSLKSHVDGELETAIEAAKILGLTSYEKIDYNIPGGDERCLIIFKKTFRTPQKFPRRYAEISKHPLP